MTAINTMTIKNEFAESDNVFDTSVSIKDLVTNGSIELSTRILRKL